MYRYSSYDAWKTENPWDGMARMAGKDEYDDEESGEEEEGCEYEPDYEDLLEHKRSR